MTYSADKGTRLPDTTLGLVFGYALFTAIGKIAMAMPSCAALQVSPVHLCVVAWAVSLTAGPAQQGQP